MYRVTSTIQSNDTSNPPVTIQWYLGESLAVAITAMAQAATDNGTNDNLPAPYGYTVKGVNLTVE